MKDERMSLLLKVIEESKKYVENGVEIPIEFQKVLFPSGRKECELVYGGKESYEQVISQVIAVPLQEERFFPQSSEKSKNEWINKLIFGDNIQVLKTLIEYKKNGLLKNPDGSDGIKLIYIDPPFSTKRDFKPSSEDQKAYSDKLAGADFIEWLRKRLILLRELLSEDGSIYIHLDNKKAAYIRVIMDEVFGENCFRSSIIWDTSIPYASGVKWTANNWIYSQATILYYSKSKSNYVFNKQFFTELYKSGGSSEKPVKDVWSDIKNFSGYLGCKDKSTGYPTQKPKELLRRIIKASSNDGDIILDCFAGSGTTLEVAEEENRKWIGIDIGKYSIYTIQKRMLLLDKVKPFALYSAGLYDEKKLNQFDDLNWKMFAMQLWGCTSKKVKIKNFEFDGNRYGDLVKVFSPQELKNLNAKISEETIKSIYSRVGDSAGKNIFIIAPKGQFTFAEDEIIIENVTFNILRIPYSMLARYTEDFTAPLQPKSVLDVNDAVDSVGFDFIQPPDVDFEITNDSIIISNFKSNSRIKGEENSTLSMVLIDYDYDGTTFDLDDILFKNNFHDGRALFDKNKIDGKAMLIFIDDTGNEKKVIING